MASHHAPARKYLTPGTIQSNKFLSDIPEKRAKIEASIAFRNNTLEAQKRVNYQNEYDRMHGLKDLHNSLIRAKVGKEKTINNTIGKVKTNNTDKHQINKPQNLNILKGLEIKLGKVSKEKNIIAQRVPVLEKRMKELKTKTKLSLKGNEQHSIYKTNF